MLNKKGKLTAKYKRDIIAKAIKKGFKRRVSFVPATLVGKSNIPSGYVKGRLLVKENYEDENESELNGDVVSAHGWGCIYDAKTNTWAQIVEE